MTTNQERAAEVIAGEWAAETASSEHLRAARALAEHEPPLLMPDLPEPTRTDDDGYALWRMKHIDISAESKTRTVFVDGGPLTPQQAREEAHALLAAAEHAEGVAR